MRILLASSTRALVFVRASEINASAFLASSRRLLASSRGLLVSSRRALVSTRASETVASALIEITANPGTPASTVFSFIFQCLPCVPWALVNL